MVKIPNKAYQSQDLLKNLFLAGQVAGRHLADDPVLLALQITRKLPYPLAQRVGACLGRLPGAGTRALGAQVRGERVFPDDAARLLRESPAERGAAGAHGGSLLSIWQGIQRRIAAEVALGFGVLDWRDESLPTVTRARAAWDAGYVSESIELAERAQKSGYASRLRGEALMLTPGWQVPLEKPGTKAPRANQDRENPKLSVLHLLTNSTPATQSGYTLRSQRLLEALLKKDISIKAYTRIGYPVMIGNLTAGAQAQDGPVIYERFLPTSLRGTQPQRLAQWAGGVLKKLSELQPQERPRLVHTTTNYPNGLVAQAVARQLGVPWVYEARGLMEETWVSNKKTEVAQSEAESSQRFSLIRNRETELMQRADHVVTLSETMKGLFVERGVAPENITVIPNAVDEKLFDQNLSPEQARAQLNLPAEGFWVGSVSSLVDYEGFDTLLRAVAQLRRKGADVRVLLAGDGVARSSLEALAQWLAEDPAVGEFAVFCGRLKPEQAYIAHQALNVFAVPRRNDRVCRSVTPLKPIEAMALGRPVLASDIPPLAELVHNGMTAPTGLLARAENPESFATALDEMMQDDAARAAYARAGRDFARSRTWAKNAEKLESIYEKLCGFPPEAPK